ncbi:MAG: hypothetical protein ABL966_11305 [Acidimicrobiales bacterium]
MRPLAVVITALMTALPAGACASDGDDGAPAATTEAPADATQEIELRFEPVMALFGTSCDEVAAGSEVEIDPSTLSPGDGACFDLTSGAGLDGSDLVATAAAELTAAGDWSVALELTPDGIDAFNELAASCFDSSATCPTGQLAIVVDGIVVSAPSIQQPSFERDQIQISGSFTEADATQLASALSNSNP